MGIGASLFLIAAGLILAFAVDVRVAGLDLDVVGLILTGVGILGLILFFTIWGSRRRTTGSTVVRERRAVDPDGPVVQERRTYDDGLP